MKERFSTYQKRGKLGEMLPLDTPFSIHLCPSTFCNFKCSYCWHSLFDENKTGTVAHDVRKEFMDLKLFNKIIKQLSEFPHKLKLFNFAWLGEPLLHPEFARMVRIAKEANIAERVEVVTNGSMLTPALVDEIVEGGGIDRVRISIQGLDEEAYLDISKYKIRYSEFLDNLKYLYDHRGHTEIYIKIMDVMVDNEEKKHKFMEMFSGMADHLNIETLVPLVNEIDLTEKKSNFEKSYFGNPVRNTNICSSVFYMLVISPNGVVLPCCSTENYSFNVGKIAIESDRTLYEIWNGEEINNLRKKMLMGKIKQIEACRDCRFPIYHTAQTDYLDEYREVLLEKY